MIVTLVVALHQRSIYGRVTQFAIIVTDLDISKALAHV